MNAAHTHSLTKEKVSYTRFATDVNALQTHGLGAKDGALPRTDALHRAPMYTHPKDQKNRRHNESTFYILWNLFNFHHKSDVPKDTQISSMPGAASLSNGTMSANSVFRMSAALRSATM